jgi:hypothetical protein
MLEQPKSALLVGHSGLVPWRSGFFRPSRPHELRLYALPIRLNPAPADRLDFWLEELARRTSYAWGDLLTAVMLTEAIGGRGGEPRRHHCGLVFRSRQSIANAAQFDPIAWGL